MSFFWPDIEPDLAQYGDKACFQAIFPKFAPDTVPCKETQLFSTFLYKLAIFIKLKNCLNVA